MKRVRRIFRAFKAEKIRQWSARWLGDVLIFTGLGLLGWGLWMLEPWVAPTVVGGLLFLMGAMGSRG